MSAMEVYDFAFRFVSTIAKRGTIFCSATAINTTTR